LGTVPDYLRFGQMLANGGEFNGKRVLSPQMVQLMTSNHLTRTIDNRVANVEPHRDGYGFGLGVAVRMEPGLAAVPGNAGEYSWNGAYGTGFLSTRKKNWWWCLALRPRVTCASTTANKSKIWSTAPWSSECAF